MPRKLILAEKPQVARDLARVLGVPASGGGSGSFSGPDHVITWCIGHLIELEEPAAYHAEWKRWAWSGLPMLPEQFRLRAIKGTQKQWRVVRDLLSQRDFSAVVNACDAGREGELIFRFCYELSRCRLPIERLWISSLTDQAITQGFRQLLSGRDYDALFDAARCRAEADWLVGMNGTRAVTLLRRQSQDVLCSIGRVQTPTLSLLVRRERQIRSFVPRDYFEVYADLQDLPAEHAPFVAIWSFLQKRRLGARTLADEVQGRSTQAAGRGEGPVVETVESKTVREPPPLLFDLTALQRTANRRFGLSAHRTLEVAQSLYEKHKLITYPRTDSRYLTSDLLPQLPRLFQAVASDPAYAGLVASLLQQPPGLIRRVFQDEKTRDHHAIIPTQVALTPAKMAALTREERQLLDLIVRRFVGAFYPDAEFQQTRVVVRVGLPAGPAPKAKGETKGENEEILETLPPPPDRYEARGRVRLCAGWQEVAGLPAARSRAAPTGAQGEEGDRQEADEQVLPRLVGGQVLRGRFRVEAKQTRPPPRYSEATLLSAMEFAGQQIENEELQREMRDVGLGTPATRAAIIETLLLRNYIERQGKLLHPTPLGMDLIECLPVPSLASPELTGTWEARLYRIARGEETRAAFMADIARYVREIVDTVRAAPAPEAVPLSAVAEQKGRRPAATGKRPRRSATPKAKAPATRPRARRDPQPPPLPPAHPMSRSGLAESVAAVGARVQPELRCPRCKEGFLMTGRRGWGCSRWQGGCPLVIPFSVSGCRLLDEDLRDLVQTGASRPMEFTGGAQGKVRARLRLAEKGSPVGYVYLEPCTDQASSLRRPDG